MCRITFFLFEQPKNMGKSAVRGSIALILSGLICKVLGAFFRVPLTYVLKEEGMGVFQLIMSLYTFALIFCSGGMSVTLSKMISKARVNADIIRMRSLYKIGILTSLILGFSVGLIFFIFAKQISFLQGSEPSFIGYTLMIILLPLGSVIACFRGIIQGNENMIPTAISQILEQSFKFVFGLAIAYFLIRFGVAFGVVGAILGIVIGEIVAFLYLLFKVRRLTMRFEGKNFDGFFKNYIPLTLSILTLPFVNAVDSFLIVGRLMAAGFSSVNALRLFGIQTGVVSAILNLPLIISTAIATSLLPAISYLSNKEFDEKTTQAFKVLWITILPMVIGIMAIARPLYEFLYPTLDKDSIELAVYLTKIGGISTILTALMQFFATILQARENLLFLLLSESIGGVIKIISVVFLCAVPEVNIFGLAIGNVLMSASIAILMLLKIKESVNLGYFDLLVPLVSSVVMLSVVIKLIDRFDVSSILLILMGVSVGVMIYSFLSFPCAYPILKEFVKKRRRKQV